jgi:hypothetical protein
MGLGPEIPKGNVYNSSDFNSDPLFAGYMEDVHKLWLGFVPPDKVTVYPFMLLENGEVEPDVGVEYIIHSYSDKTYTTEIDIDKAMQGYYYLFKGDNFDFEELRTSSGTLKGIRVTNVWPCRYIKNLGFDIMVHKYMKYYEMRSVTQTMNEVFDLFISDVDRFATVKETFRSLVDIRRLEKF